ncbi:unnamed protein product [Paramecium sonneborni]|uniref:Uncharacterized protein n=1 Tax=Paramecium sonneborni TaxID=65129 RepID=A0A8S1MQW2_9CILI|nr:unnamed protein product [Paramecium sonneborni]
MESQKLSQQLLKQCLYVSKSEFIEQINLKCSRCISALKDYITLNQKDKYITINSEISLNDDLIHSQYIFKTLSKLSSYGQLTNLQYQVFSKRLFHQTIKKDANYIHQNKSQKQTSKNIFIIFLMKLWKKIKILLSKKKNLINIYKQSKINWIQNYLKTKKFCSSCKQNIYAVLKHFKQQIYQSECACSINCFIKYDQQKNEILIPYDAILLNELLNKVQIQPFYQHASTEEDAQEELLICIGLLIKDKLITLYREYKSQQFIKYTFYQQIGDIFSKRLENCNKMKECYSSKLQELEQYLMQEDEQKDKQRQKRKQKRKKRKEQQLSSDGSVKTNYQQESSRRSIKFYQNILVGKEAYQFIHKLEMNQSSYKKISIRNKQQKKIIKRINKIMLV